MSFVVSRHGDMSLLVAAQAVDERAIAHALKQLNDRLILDVGVDERSDQLVYRVMYRHSEGAEFVCAWTDAYGNPLPLSHQLVAQVKRQIAGDGLAEAKAHNERLREQASRDTIAEATEIADEMLPWVEGKRRHYGVFARRNRERREQHATLRELEERRAAQEEPS